MFKKLWARLRLAIYFAFSWTPDPHSPHIRFFRFSIPLVLKQSRESVSTESDALNFLQNCGVKLPVPIPRLFDSVDYDGANYALITRIPGRTLLSLLTHPEKLTVEEVDGIMEDLLQLIRALWKIRQEQYGRQHRGLVMCSASGHGLPHSGEEYELRGPCNVLDSYATRSYHVQDERSPRWDGYYLAR